MADVKGQDLVSDWGEGVTPSVFVPTVGYGIHHLGIEVILQRVRVRCLLYSDCLYRCGCV